MMTTSVKVDRLHVVHIFHRSLLIDDALQDFEMRLLNCQSLATCTSGPSRTLVRSSIFSSLFKDYMNAAQMDTFNHLQTTAKQLLQPYQEGEDVDADDVCDETTFWIYDRRFIGTHPLQVRENQHISTHVDFLELGQCWHPIRIVVKNAHLNKHDHQLAYYVFKRLQSFHDRHIEFHAQSLENINVTFPIPIDKVMHWMEEDVVSYTPKVASLIDNHFCSMILYMQWFYQRSKWKALCFFKAWSYEMVNNDELKMSFRLVMFRHFMKFYEFTVSDFMEQLTACWCKSQLWCHHDDPYFKVTKTKYAREVCRDWRNIPSRLTIQFTSWLIETIQESDTNQLEHHGETDDNNMHTQRTQQFILYLCIHVLKSSTHSIVEVDSLMSHLFNCADFNFNHEDAVVRWIETYYDARLHQYTDMGHVLDIIFNYLNEWRTRNNMSHKFDFAFIPQKRSHDNVQHDAPTAKKTCL